MCAHAANQEQKQEQNSLTKYEVRNCWLNVVCADCTSTRSTEKWLRTVNVIRLLLFYFSSIECCCCLSLTSSIVLYLNRANWNVLGRSSDAQPNAMCGEELEQSNFEWWCAMASRDYSMLRNWKLTEVHHTIGSQWNQWSNASARYVPILLTNVFTFCFFFFVCFFFFTMWPKAW